jgi:NAD(P)-dependent dehydrogenase (short-subunit alcohol dehydrogenase family)
MSVAVIGAGDYIGAAIARKFAAERFLVFAGRRHGEKLAPLVAEIETAGGRIVGRSLDARNENALAIFMHEAERGGAT